MLRLSPSLSAPPVSSESLCDRFIRLQGSLVEGVVAVVASIPDCFAPGFRDLERKKVCDIRWALVVQPDILAVTLAVVAFKPCAVFCDEQIHVRRVSSVGARDDSTESVVQIDDKRSREEPRHCVFEFERLRRESISVQSVHFFSASCSYLNMRGSQPVLVAEELFSPPTSMSRVATICT